jgi:uncharacterized protein
MNVVSNASPLINLAHIGQFALLREVYQGIVIPEAVWNEVVAEGSGQPGAAAVKRATWISVQPITNTLLVQSLRQDLDGGEAEAIVLALEINADLLLMDERLGRRVARHFGVSVSGLIGLCIEAKRKGIIAAIKPVLDSLRDRAGFRISPSLYELVLADSGEL